MVKLSHTHSFYDEAEIQNRNGFLPTHQYLNCSNFTMKLQLYYSRAFSLFVHFFIIISKISLNFFFVDF